MEIRFNPKGHTYESIDPSKAIDWIGVTSIVSKLKEPFDADAQSVKSSKNKRSKWYGLSPEEIKAHWNKESQDAVDLGHFYHDQQETELTSFSTIVYQGKELPIFKTMWDAEYKVSPPQKLTEGVYPEHLVYLKSAGICGQSDKVTVLNDTVDISDFKTNKEIRFESYRNWEGKAKMLNAPVSHLEDCEIVHYGLQLSLYMYMILKHNPLFKPGKLTINHVIFEEHARNKFNQRSVVLDENKKPIVKQVINHTVPYYANEAKAIVDAVVANREYFKKR